jgi:hypothetical protein
VWVSWSSIISGTAGEQEGNENGEEAHKEPPKKRKRMLGTSTAATRKLPPAAKSKEFIVDSDESEGGDD